VHVQRYRNLVKVTLVKARQPIPPFSPETTVALRA
jgi:hypothetical protein